MSSYFVVWNSMESETYHFILCSKVEGICIGDYPCIVKFYHDCKQDLYHSAYLTHLLYATTFCFN